MSRAIKRPTEGQQVKLLSDYGDHDVNAVVRELLDTQFTSTYEVMRPDGGWKEVTRFRFYNDRGTTWEMS